MAATTHVLIFGWSQNCRSLATVCVCYRSSFEVGFAVQGSFPLQWWAIDVKRASSAHRAPLTSSQASVFGARHRFSTVPLPVIFY